MRIIRTEMYFEHSQVVGFERHRSLLLIDPEEDPNPGLAFAWIKTDTPGPVNLANYKWFDGSELPPEDIELGLDFLIRGGDARGVRRWRRSEPIKNQSIVKFIFDQPIIIEESPPKAVTFKDLLKKTNGPLWIGAIMGYRLAGDSSALLFLTVPGGIIVVSTALGVAEAIAMGLNKRLQRLFEGS